MQRRHQFPPAIARPERTHIPGDSDNCTSRFRGSENNGPVVPQGPGQGRRRLTATGLTPRRARTVRGPHGLAGERAGKETVVVVAVGWRVLAWFERTSGLFGITLRAQHSLRRNCRSAACCHEPPQERAPVRFSLRGGVKRRRERWPGASARRGVLGV
jgi:hypothetical protein